MTRLITKGWKKGVITKFEARFSSSRNRTYIQVTINYRNNNLFYIIVPGHRYREFIKTFNFKLNGEEQVEILLNRAKRLIGKKVLIYVDQREWKGIISNEVRYIERLKIKETI